MTDGGYQPFGPERKHLQSGGPSSKYSSHQAKKQISLGASEDFRELIKDFQGTALENYEAWFLPVGFNPSEKISQFGSFPQGSG